MHGIDPHVQILINLQLEFVFRDEFHHESHDGVCGVFGGRVRVAGEQGEGHVVFEDLAGVVQGFD